MMAKTRMDAIDRGLLRSKLYDLRDYALVYDDNLRAGRMDRTEVGDKIAKRVEDIVDWVERICNAHAEAAEKANTTHPH